MKTQILLISIVMIIVVACNSNNKNKSISSEIETNQMEDYRPQYHFTPDSMWMNDPNGMVYYEGEYHLFYQYYPNSTVWGPMHWGHAVSHDMIHWEHLPIALYPDSLGYIFSGSAVIDWENTTGFGSTENPPMIAIYTYHDPKGEKAGTDTYQTQGIAYSLDKGRSWTKYKNNPVLPNPGIRDFRDPKVIWHKETGKWVMVFAAQDRVKFYTSPNLIDWTFESDFGMELGAHGGVWECPDIFPLSIEESNEEKWVLLVSINPGGPNFGSATQYFVGDFDGQGFIPSSEETNWIDYGADNYAGVTWSDIPENDGRRLFIGWMSNWLYATKVPTERWRSAMTIPRELQLIKDNNEYKLISIPVIEQNKLRKGKISMEAQVVSGEATVETGDINLMQSELKLTFQLNEDSQFGIAEEFGLELSNSIGQTLRIGYDQTKRKFYIDRSKAGRFEFSTLFAAKHYAPYEAKSQLELRIFMDASSVEVFVDGGQLAMTDIVFPDAPYKQMKIYSLNGHTKLLESEFWNMDTIWK